MKRKIYLYGYLGEKYGKCHTLFVHSMAETIRALKANFPDFYDSIRDGSFHILRGKDLQNCEEICEEELRILFSKGDFHIVPAVEGCSGGWVNAIIGVVLIIAGILTVIYGPKEWGVGMVLMGIGFLIGGVVQLLTPVPKIPSYGTRETPDQRASFIFNGATNRMEQGGPVPLGFGEMIVGSVVIAGALDVEQLV